MKLTKSFLLLIFLSLTTPVFALNLDQAKANGQLGEAPSGYLEIVSPPGSPEAQALMKDINSKRQKKYQQIAKENGTQLKAVEALAGKSAIEKTKPGNYVRLPSGKWEKK